MFYPYNRYYSYYPYYRKNNYVKKDDDIRKDIQTTNKNADNKICNKIENNNLKDSNNKNKSSRFDMNEEPFLDILGIKLYLDDLIILCLLFFLYQEEVKDEILFISLILLLLS